MNTHLSTQFDADLDEIRADLTRMGGLVEEQVRAALAAFAEGNGEGLDDIIRRDAEVDAKEVAIDEACAHVVARRQPTAVDLRMVMAVSKTVTDLERIGDEAKKIAKTTRKILERGNGAGAKQMVDVRTMGGQVTAMLHDVLDAFVRLDTGTAMQVVRRDKEIDRHFRAVTRQLVTYMMEDPRTITTALDIIFIAKSVERIGDHCKNIAKDIIYIASGRDVRHLDLDALEREAQSE